MLVLFLLANTAAVQQKESYEGAKRCKMIFWNLVLPSLTKMKTDIHKRVKKQSITSATLYKLINIYIKTNGVISDLKLLGAAGY